MWVHRKIWALGGRGGCHEKLKQIYKGDCLKGRGLDWQKRGEVVFLRSGVWYPNAHCEYFLDNPVFRLVAILKSKVFKKQIQRNPTCKKICIFENCSVSMNSYFILGILIFSLRYS